MQSESWDSGISAFSSIPKDSLNGQEAREDDIPTPPPLPKVSYLLDNITSKNSSDEENDKAEEDTSDNESHHSSRRKARRKKNRSSKDEPMDWTYNRLTVPQSSPPRERRALRRPSPASNPSHMAQDFLHTADEVNKKLESSQLSTQQQTPPPKSPIGSPHISPSSSSSQISIPSSTNTHPVPKRAAPILAPNLQNRQGAQSSQPASDSVAKRNAPILLKGSSRTKSTQRPAQQPSTTASLQPMDQIKASSNDAIPSPSNTLSSVGSRYTTSANADFVLKNPLVNQTVRNKTRVFYAFYVYTTLYSTGGMEVSEVSK